MKIIPYLGDGTQFIMGVPARDLTEVEFYELPVEQQNECVKSGLYQVTPADPREMAVSGQINLADGVDNDEASLAGQTLAARKAK